MTEPKRKRTNRKEENTLPSEGEIHAILAARDEPVELSQDEQAMDDFRVTATALWQRPVGHHILIKVQGKHYLYQASDWHGEREFDLDSGLLMALEQPEDWTLLFPDAGQLIRESFYMTGVVTRKDLSNANLRFGLQRLVSALAKRFSEYKE